MITKLSCNYFFKNFRQKKGDWLITATLEVWGTYPVNKHRLIKSNMEVWIKKISIKSFNFQTEKVNVWMEWLIVYEAPSGTIFVCCKGGHITNYVLVFHIFFSIKKKNPYKLLNSKEIKKQTKKTHQLLQIQYLSWQFTKSTRSTSMLKKKSS